MSEEIWKVTRGTDELEAVKAAERKEAAEIVRSLRKCPVCGGDARIVVFGLECHGVWVGCDETDECARYIEYHSEGWSIKEVVGEWNKYNSGWRLCVRKMKMWFRRLFSAEKRKERAENRRESKEKARKEEERRQFYGVKKPKRHSRLVEMLERFGKKAESEV